MDGLTKNCLSWQDGTVSIVRIYVNIAIYTNHVHNDTIIGGNMSNKQNIAEAYYKAMGEKDIVGVAQYV